MGQGPWEKMAGNGGVGADEFTDSQVTGPKPPHPPPNRHSLPEFMSFKLFGKTILVVNIKLGAFFWAIHASEGIIET